MTDEERIRRVIEEDGMTIEDAQALMGSLAKMRPAAYQKNRDRIMAAAFILHRRRQEREGD